MSSPPARSLLQEVIARCSRLNVPAQAVLELTYRCNLSCVHCYVDLAETDELTLEEWQGVVDQLKAAGTIYLLFTGGEVLLRDDFLDIATYARRSGFLIGLLSNLTLITADMARALAELKPLSLGTSLYGATAATHDAVTSKPGSFARTIEGIRLLVANGIVPTVQTLVMKVNMAELTEVKRLVESLGAKSRVDLGMIPSKTGARFPLDHEPGVEELVGCSWRPDSPNLDDLSLIHI